jgi:hypothetical protein
MIRRGLFAFLAAIACATPVFAAGYDCNIAEDPDKSQMLAAGMELADACICGDAQKPGDYNRCVKGVLRTRQRAGLLRGGCSRVMQYVYLPAVCGYPAGTVACATGSLSHSNPRPRCRIVKNEDLCTPPARGGVACQSVTCYDATSGVYDPDSPYSDCTTRSNP